MSHYKVTDKSRCRVIGGRSNKEDEVDTSHIELQVIPLFPLPLRVKQKVGRSGS